MAANLQAMIVSIAVASATTLMGVTYIDQLGMKSQDSVEAVRLLNEGQQLANAATVMILETGSGPNGTQADPIGELRARGYMSSVPMGGMANGERTGWRIDYEKRAVMSRIGNLADNHALKICRAARRRLELPNPDLIYNCSGADAPGGILGDREPCCINTGD